MMQPEMEIIKYKSTHLVTEKAIELGKEVYHTNESASFRIYDSEGWTLQFHVHYFRDLFQPQS